VSGFSAIVAGPVITIFSNGTLVADLSSAVTGQVAGFLALVAVFGRGLWAITL